MLDENEMIIKCNSLEDYNTLKELSEKMGWIYNEEFQPFSEDDLQRIQRYGDDCFYYSSLFKLFPGIPAFSLSTWPNPEDIQPLTEISLMKLQTLLHVLIGSKRKFIRNFKKI